MLFSPDGTKLALLDYAYQRVPKGRILIVDLLQPQKEPLLLLWADDVTPYECGWKWAPLIP